MAKNVESVQGRNELFSAMDGGTPFKTYVKTILGKVYVTAWDNFTNQPIGMILEGDPRQKSPTALIDMWSEKENVFFKRMNKRHFDAGVLIEYKRVDEVRERTIEEFTDEELIAILSKPFLALQNTLNKTESEAVLYRLEGLATGLDKPEKTMRAIKSRLSEIQQAPLPEPSVEEG